MVNSDDKFEKRAQRFLTRTPGVQNNEQTIKFIAEIYSIENKLTEVEANIDKSNPWLQTRELKKISEDLGVISEDVHLIQKIITSPDDHLHEIVDICEDEINESAVSEILTQLNGEWLPRELNRLYSTHSRVFRKFGAKKQHILTNRIVVLSLLAVFLSVAGILSSYFV